MENISREIRFKTARSGGKGGQNVNKVETMVEGYWSPAGSALFTEEEKTRITDKLTHKINAEGFVVAKSQQERTQLANKAIVVKKIRQWILSALKKEKPRKPSRPTRASVENRIEEKKKLSSFKQNRKKIIPDVYKQDL